MRLSDEEIIYRVQNGDRSAYLELFDRYYVRVERYARRQVPNAETARDLASETFLRAYRNVDNFRSGGDGTYLGYLLMICRRLAYTEQARLRARPVETWEEAEMEVVPDESAALPLARLLAAERNAMIQEAMERLPADDREIIRLAFECELSRRDIMEIMGKPSVSAVTSHLYRAMQRLRATVVQQGYFAA